MSLVRIGLLGFLVAMGCGKVSAVTVPVTHVIDKQSLDQLDSVLSNTIELFSAAVKTNIRHLTFTATGIALVYLGLSIVRDQLNHEKSKDKDDSSNDDSSNINKKSLIFGLGTAGAGLALLFLINRS